MKTFLVIVGAVVAVLLLTGLVRAIFWPARNSPARSQNILLDILMIDFYIGVFNSPGSFFDSDTYDTDTDFD
jgi:hypothetical protein